MSPLLKSLALFRFLLSVKDGIIAQLRAERNVCPRAKQHHAESTPHIRRCDSEAICDRPYRHFLR